MPLRIRDRVKQRTLTIGTGVITFSSSLSSFQDFSGVLSDGDVTYYTIQNTSQFEVGQATYSGNTLDRDQVFVSSSGSSRIYLNQEADVFITYPASKAVFLEIENNITGVDAFDFNTGVSPSYKQGRIFYDTDNGALSVYNDEADITLQVGQEEYLRARNNTTGTISNGQAVRIIGSQGTNPIIDLAIATGSLSSQLVGLATHDIESSSFGYITTFGIVRGVDTSAYDEGGEVYLSPVISGGLTGVAPIAPYFRSPVGHVIRKHPSVGSILVAPRVERLGGPDVKSTNGNNIGVSGVTFVELLTNEGAAILASSTGMVYDSGNQILEINAGGIKYPDGQTQTIAYTGQTADLSSYATTSYVNSVSGNLQTEITSNSSDITALQTATGLLDTDVKALQTATGLLDTDVQELQTATGLLEVRVTQNETDITSLETATGLLDTRVTQNQTDINSVSGQLYNNWNINVTGNIDSIESNQTVIFTGIGLASVAYNESTNTVTISGAGDGGGAGGGYDWNISVTGLSDTIASGETVVFTGLGNTSLFYNPSTNTVSVSGADQDLSSYATTTYVDNISGNLQSQITSNDNDISSLQTATGLLETRVTQNETDITALDTATGLLETRVTQNETDITALETATGLLDTRVTQNDNDIDSVSGLLYNYWVLRGDGATTTNVDSTEQVQFKGAGSVSVSLGGTDNREVTISGIAPSGGGMTNWNLSVTGDSTAITQAETVTFSGQGNVIASRSGNFVIITGVDQDLSSYATTSFVNSVSGNLQSEIDSNDTDISALQTATGLLETRVTQNETDITALETATGNLDTRVTQNTNDISSVSGLLYNNWNVNVTGNVDSITSNETVLFTGVGNTSITYNSSTNTVSISGTDQDLSSYATTAYVNSVSGNLQGEIDSNDTDIANLQTATGNLDTRVSQNETDITALETATGNLDTRVTQNTSDITSVSGLLYNNWKINVTGNIDDITSEQTVIFTGINGTDVTYNSSTNTVSISGGGGGTTYTAGSGLTLVGTEFNTADTGLFERIHFYNGSIQIGKEAKVDNNIDTAIAIGNYAAKNLEPLELYILGNPSTWSTGDNGTYIGYKAGQGSAGVGHTYIGFQAASGFISPTYKGSPQTIEYVGNQNCIAIGVRALYKASGTLDASDEPIQNIVAIGYNAAAQSVGSLTDLLAIGSTAGSAATDIKQSTFIGVNAGANASGIRNVAIGYNSLKQASGTNNIEIITYRTATPSVIAGYDNKIHIENTIIGDTSSKLIAIGNVGTSDVVPDATLEIKPNLSTDIGLIVQGAASHSVNLQEWQDSSENVLAFVDTRGTVSGSGFIFQDGVTQTIAYTGQGGMTSWNVGVTGTSDPITDGQTVTFTGAGQSNVTYNPSTNTVLISGVNGSAPTGNHSGIAYFGSNNLITENTDFTISDSGKVYSKVSFGSLDDQGNQSGTITFNANESNFHLATLTGNSTLAITGEDIGQKILIRLKQDGVGGHTVNWWNNIKWAEGGTEPTLTTTSEKADMFGFIVTSGVGPYFYDGFIVGQNI